MSLSKNKIVLRFTHFVDVDECLSGTSDCQHICINNVGGFNCECEFGYALHDIDRKTCEKGIGLNQISCYINILIYTFKVLFSIGTVDLKQIINLFNLWF